MQYILFFHDALTVLLTHVGSCFTSISFCSVLSCYVLSIPPRPPPHLCSRSLTVFNHLLSLLRLMKYVNHYTKLLFLQYCPHLVEVILRYKFMHTHTCDVVYILYVLRQSLVLHIDQYMDFYSNWWGKLSLSPLFFIINIGKWVYI